MTNVTRVKIFGGVFALLLALQAHADTLLDGQDINLEQIRRGLAWLGITSSISGSSHLLTGTYSAAEDAARAAQAGLWRDAAPVPPWEFRHSK